MKRPPYFSRFDSQEVAGKFYNTGDTIEADVHPAVLQVLIDQGRVSTDKVVVIDGMTTGTAVEDMSRAELESAAREVLTAQVADADDDRLRNLIASHRDEEADKAKADGDTSEGDGSKPLDKMTKGELEAVASEEGVTFGDDVTNNAGRIKAIEDARAAKSSS